jgi:peroxiredoxin Q/BCP
MACNVGDKAPAFDCATDGNGTLSLKDLKGKKAVLYFYPKDMTPGCTKEAEDFRDLHRKFKNANAIVVGISKDSPARHDKFIEKYKLPFPLISDEDGALCDAYGVWVEKSMYGRKYMGIERATFLLDETGKIREIWRKVKVKGHSEAVLAALKAL